MDGALGVVDLAGGIGELLQDLKPMRSHFHMRHESHASDFKPLRLYADKAYDIPHLRRWL